PGSLLPLPCGPHHVLVAKVGQTAEGEPVQVTPPGGQRGDLAEGSVDRVLLGRGAQRLLSGREILVVDLDEGLGHCCPPSPSIYPRRLYPDIFTRAVEDARVWEACSSIAPAAPQSPANHPRSGSRTCSSRPCSPPPGSLRTRTISH